MNDISTVDVETRTLPSESIATRERERSQRNVLRGLTSQPLVTWPNACTLREEDFDRYRILFNVVRKLICSAAFEKKTPKILEQTIHNVVDEMRLDVDSLDIVDIFGACDESAFISGVHYLRGGRMFSAAEHELTGKVSRMCESIREIEVGIQHVSGLNRKSVWDAIQEPAPMAEIIIDGLVRRGEVMNLVSSTKVGKSWLAAGLMFSVAKGLPWFCRRVTKGNVLLIDNELQPETIENRMFAVADAMRIKHEPTDAEFDYTHLRGQQANIQDVESELMQYKPGELAMIVLDAKYRFFGSMEENSNDDQTTFHNIVDRLATRLQSVIVLVHHSTKGDQGGKNVTDVGSGGGAQSRAADTHLIIRPHAEEGMAVLDAAVRTFAPVSPQTLRWEFPLWHSVDDVQPILKADRTRGDSRQESKDRQALSELADIIRQAQGTPQTVYDLRSKSGIGQDRVSRLVRLGISEGMFVITGTKINRKGEESDLITLPVYADQYFIESRTSG